MEKYSKCEKVRNVRMFYDIGASNDDEFEVVRNRGLITLSIKELLEKYNYRTSLTLFSTFILDSNNYLYIKYNFDNNNNDAIFYPMCHTGFNRLIILELIGRLTDIVSRTYHYMQEEDVKRLINIGPNDILINCYTSSTFISGKERDATS